MTHTLIGRAIVGLVIIVVLSIGGITFLSIQEKSVPDVLEQAVTAGIVGLVGLLPGAMKETVRVDNPPNDPVHVEAA